MTRPMGSSPAPETKTEGKTKQGQLSELWVSMAAGNHFQDLSKAHPGDAGYLVSGYIPGITTSGVATLTDPESHSHPSAQSWYQQVRDKLISREGSLQTAWKMPALEEPHAARDITVVLALHVADPGSIANTLYGSFRSNS